MSRRAPGPAVASVYKSRVSKLLSRDFPQLPPFQTLLSSHIKKGDYALMRLVGDHIEMLSIPKDQRWLWTPEWQKKGRQVDEEIARGNVKTFNSVEELLKDLESR